jgi:hypothetical protein
VVTVVMVAAVIVLVVAVVTRCSGDSDDSGDLRVANKNENCKELSAHLIVHSTSKTKTHCRHRSITVCRHPITSV